MSIHKLKSKPLAHLEEEMIEATKNFVIVEPIFLQKLAMKMKSSEIAELLGYTPSGISAILNEGGKCRKVVELAAELIYEQNFGMKKGEPKPVCAFVTGDLQLMKMVQGMVSIGAGNFAFVEMPK